VKLKRKTVAKPWGQFELPEIFGGTQKRQIGEIWFEPPEGVTPSLMVKYLFTSEKLSIQVHPNDRLARRAGLPHGKEECWYILDAEPDAVLGIGLTKTVSDTKLRAAAVLGEIEQLIDWKPVKAGDFYYIPAGTIHAIGAGVTLIEVQQNIDITYRLYDYGRPRELHLDDAIAVAKPKQYDMAGHQFISNDQSQLMVDGPHFRLFQLIDNDIDLISGIEAGEWQVVPIDGQATVRGKLIKAGECGLSTSYTEIDLSKCNKALVACSMK